MTQETLPDTGAAWQCGDYTATALHQGERDWRREAARALQGTSPRALHALTSSSNSEARFYLAVAHWMNREDNTACRILDELKTPHAANLAALIRQPRLHVLSQSVWLPDEFTDSKFTVRPVGIPRTIRSKDGWEVPNRVPLKEPFRRVLPMLDGQPAPHFYFTNMLEWEYLPFDLQELPCPVFGVTSDFDIHIQNLYPWLSQFDELITVGSEERQKVARLTERPVSVFAKMFPLPPDLPSLPREPRCFDLYISGTIANPYHPDKAALLHQLLQRSQSRICYVDGFVAPSEYYEQMGRSKASFTYVRHGTSMPSRGLEALAMGCAVLVQKGSPLTMFAGEDEGVLTYSAEGRELPAALDEILRNWPKWERRARRGAAIVRQEFTRAKCLSQFLRYLTVLAARPRPARVAANTVRYHKRGVLRRGHCYSTPIALGMLDANLKQERPKLDQMLQTQRSLSLAREVDLFLSSDMREVLRNLDHSGGEPERVQRVLSDRERMRATAVKLYAEALSENPDSLVARFNAFRHAVHLGPSEGIPSALEHAREVLNRPASQWQVDPMDDVFPWDYHSSLFNYRAYLDLATAILGGEPKDAERLKSLILASLHGYLGLYSGDPEDLIRATDLDPEFPFYRFRLAQALVQRGQPGDRQRAADLYAELALSSILIEPCFAGLTALVGRDDVQAQAFGQIERVVRRLRNSLETSHFDSKEYERVSLVFPPGVTQLPLARRTPTQLSGPVHEIATRNWQADGRGSHRVRTGSDRNRPRILLIPFECANWQNARAWSYTGYYAFEEGLRANGAEFVTLPAIAGFPSDHPASWLNYARTLCREQQFDQAWIWVTHNEYHPALLEWLREVAPVRLGVVMESLEHSPEELECYPKLSGRRERVMTLLRHLTGVLAFDEFDAKSLAHELPLRALWCPPVVPWRSVCNEVELPKPGPAIFQGTLYSPERQAFLRLPELRKHLVKPRLPEDDTSIPGRFDEIQLRMLSTLARYEAPSPAQLESYLGEIRRVRRRLFGLWLESVSSGYANVNLPSVFKCYAGRVVESMAVGRPVISWDPPRARTRALFTPNEEILLFDRARPEELRNQIERLQKDPEFARCIAERARDKVLRYHTAEIRVRQILDWVENDIQPEYGERIEADQNPNVNNSAPLSSSTVGGSMTASEIVSAAAKRAEQEPTNTGAWVELARTAAQAGHFAQCDSALDRALELEPDDRDALKLLADLCARDGNDKTAVQAYNRILQKRPNDVLVLHATASTLENAGEWDATFAVYEHLIKTSPADVVLAERVDRLRKARGLAPNQSHGPANASLQDKPAAGSSEAATPFPATKQPKAPPSIELPPCARLGHLAKVHGLLSGQSLRDAWGGITTCLTSRPYHPEAYLMLSEIAQALGDVGLARQCGGRARELAPGWKPARKFLKRLPRHGKPVKLDWARLPETSVSPRLSVCLIAKNEEKFIGQCLASVKALASQIVVVDTGSTDRTVEIAKEHGAEVHFFKWCDDFSAARNATLEHATGDWILMLDADEVLPDAEHERLRKLMTTPGVIAWRLPIVDAGKEQNGRSFVPRLFRNAPALFYYGRIHEQVFSSIEVRRREWGLETRLGDATLVHYGYTDAVMKDRNKIERNLRLLEMAVQEAPNEANLLMNHGLELVRSGRLSEGLEQYRAALRALEELPKEDVVPELRETLLTQASAQLTKAKCHEEVKQVLTSPLARSAPFTATLHFSLGLAYMGTGEFAEAASQMRLCLEKLDTPTLTPINPEVRKGGPRHCLAVCLSKVGQPEEAEQEFRTALSEKPDSVKTAVEFARHLISVGRAVDALQELHNFVSQVPGAAAAWEFGARIALGHPEFLEVALDWTAEAQRLHPEHPEILLLRAETLVLAGNTEDALDLCRSGKVSTVALGSALTTACEASHQELLTTIEARQENNVSSEFLKLYRKLLTFNASEVVGRINTRLEELSQVLPSAASNLRAALTEAGLEPVQSTKML